MAVSVVEKRKGVSTCGDCEATLAANIVKCDECGSENIKKSIVIVRKETEDDDLDDQTLSDVVEDDDDDEVEEEDEEEDESDDEEDEDEDDEEEVEEPVLEKSFIPSASLEALNLSTALAESVSKALSSKKPAEKYESVMTEFNAVMDGAFATWSKNKTVAKADSSKEQAALINKRVTEILKDGDSAMPDAEKKERPDGFDDLPDAVKEYITSLESGEGVAKNDDGEEDIYKGLTPAAAEIVKKAAETNERAEAQKYMDVAKSLKFIPGDRDTLAKSLREAAEKSPDAYKVLLDSLAAANEVAKDSSVFKSYGNPNPGAGDDSDISKRAKALVEKGEYATIEQAEVALMDGKSYTPTTGTGE